MQADLLAVVGVWAVEELDAGEGAGELAAAGDPGNGGALVKKEAGVEELHALLLDQPHPQHLALLLIGNQLGWQHLQPTITSSANIHFDINFLSSFAD